MKNYLSKKIGLLAFTVLAISGGLSFHSAVAVNNPMPQISSITPTSELSGNTFEFIVFGSGFVPESSAGAGDGSKIAFDNTPLATTFISANQLKLTNQLTSSVAGNHAITVVNPKPGGGTSAPINFYFTYPWPVITSISPSSVLAGSAPFDVMVNGSGFLANTNPPASGNDNSTKISIGGIIQTTQYISPNQLKVLQYNPGVFAGNFLVSAYSPLSGGGGGSTYMNVYYPPNQGGIHVEITASGGDPATNYTFNYGVVGGNNPTGSITMKGDGTSPSSPGPSLFLVNQGNYSVNGTPPPGWAVSKTCFDGNSTIMTSSFSINANQTISCVLAYTFTPSNPPVLPHINNIHLDSIIKGQSPGSTINGTGFNANSIVKFFLPPLNPITFTTTFHAASAVANAYWQLEATDLNNLSPGVYTVQIINADGAASNQATFTVNTPPTNLIIRKVIANGPPAPAVPQTFTFNVRTSGSVLVPYVAVNASSVGTFSTNVSVPLPGPANIYTIQEDPLPGWTLVGGDGQCDNGQAASAVQLSNAAVVTCTFTNQYGVISSSPISISPQQMTQGQAPSTGATITGANITSTSTVTFSQTAYATQTFPATFVPATASAAASWQLSKTQLDSLPGTGMWNVVVTTNGIASGPATFNVNPIPSPTTSQIRLVANLGGTTVPDCGNGSSFYYQFSVDGYPAGAFGLCPPSGTISSIFTFPVDSLHDFDILPQYSAQSTLVSASCDMGTPTDGSDDLFSPMIADGGGIFDVPSIAGKTNTCTWSEWYGTNPPISNNITIIENNPSSTNEKICFSSPDLPDKNGAETGVACTDDSENTVNITKYVTWANLNPGTYHIDQIQNGSATTPLTSITTTGAGMTTGTNISYGNAASGYNHTTWQPQDFGVRMTIPANTSTNFIQNFNNNPAAGASTITVTKKIIPATDPGKFDLLINGATFTFDAGNDGTTGPQSTSPSNIITPASGSYTITEEAGTATNLADYTTAFSGDCIGLPGIGGVITSLKPGNNTCIITNTKITNPNPPPPPGQGALRVKKIAIGGTSSQNYSFQYSDYNPTTGSSNPLGISVSVNGNGTTMAPDKAMYPGTYKITESGLLGWQLTGVSCDNGTPAITADDMISGPGALPTITIVAGQTNTCTWTNTFGSSNPPPPPGQGTLKIIKKTIGGPNNSQFEFSFTINPGTIMKSFEVPGDSPSYSPGSFFTTADLNPGNYTITEDKSAAGGSAVWPTTTVACGSSQEAAGTSSSFTITAGQTTTCTFTNTYYTANPNPPPPPPPTNQGSLTIVKNTTGGDEVFSYVISSGNSSAGAPASISTSQGTGSQGPIPAASDQTYSITENLMSGWNLDSISCKKEDQTSTGTVSLASGSVSNIAVETNKTTTCTFSNSKVTNNPNPNPNPSGSPGTNTQYPRPDKERPEEEVY